ncbi:phospholipase D [Coniochaeta ligniaria NRRL 30616]|uniref:Phospholipase D1 n=1 Tax=Coniochaeta ligniaria NRRL 30616 TaxID=1408157 RepID=A0A1J7J770_9PEZI|nr:phospholipase D [Coniochaeta ligniaria NRRL 30616]
MNESVRIDAPLAAVEEEQRLSSGKLVEPSSLFRKQDLADRTYSGSDTFDFGSQPSSPTKQRHDKIDDDGATPPAEDYLNGGHPHEDVAPMHNHNLENGNGAATLSPTSAASTPRLAPAPIIVTDSSRSGADLPSFTAEPAEMSTPVQGRRSVQFARNDTVLNDLPLPPSLSQTNSHVRNSSWDARDAIGKIRSSAFMAKLKELAAPVAHTDALGIGSTTSSPTVTRHSTRAPGFRNMDQNEGSDVDADAEETADEGPTGPGIGANGAVVKTKKKRRMRRPRDILSTPTTPRFASQGGDLDTPVQHSRLNFIRRATIADTLDHRAGLSEGEGRDQFDRERSMFRTGSWGLNHVDTPDGGESPSRARMGHFRRISAFGGRGVGDGGVSDGGVMTPRVSRPFFGGERASTYGAQKWQQVKRTLKALRKQKTEQIDYMKSVELMAELRAGAPAVLMLASMIQRDEHGNKRIPVLLEQLKLKIRNSEPVQDGDSERHWLFTIDLEYGSGPSRMTWTVKRTIREILNMHWKYKLTLKNEKYLTNQLNLGSNRPKQPSFPLSAFPYLRGVRGLEDDEDKDEPMPPGGDDTAGEVTAAEMTAAEGTATEGEGRPRPKKKRSRMNVLAGRRKSSGLIDLNGSNADLSQLDAAAARRRYVERQQRMLEKYLTEMVHWLIFRPDSNRLCRFLELSALGVRLAAEGSYHGKECYLHIQSSKGLDFRRVLTPQRVFARHTRKWFLVRQSYIVCVESPENMNIYDVYLVDPKFKIISKKSKLKQITSTNAEEEIDLTVNPLPEKHHTLKILTSERKVTLFSRNQHIVRQFEESITEMLKATPWHIRNRFGSFAPVRTGVHAQWLVDGRDYMWNVSRAINMARDVIYIHDWWLSPELYMRRPACISQKWRLDRLLQKKAKEGVKIFIIIYRNVEAAVPIDSEYTKFSLLNLHPNIFVQRSPNQLKKNQFFFAHHEKICIVDHDVAFVGGIDLCFGRWDCPQHPIGDDKPTGFENTEDPKDAEHCQLFPGKDYSNPRVQDFFRLNEPYEEMYDRSRIPRMPWHDVSMQVVGQPARDLTRHFVQRWNYVRRGRKPTRPTPFLLPPPDYKKEDLDALGLTGTCEVQILRSACGWSLGIDDTESSIQSAYVKMIEESEHFVYIENQFFITSTETLNNKMVNRIGDALVERAIRAHEKDEDWRAVILIPLMPGFQNEVNEQDGTSVRLILQCQFRSICRGNSSIFGRLRAAGIAPEDYIQFFSLRQWGKIGNNLLTTEQLYIHAKVIVVDDRVALIGSANINERSMLGNRDSECAAVVRDTDMLWSTMGGKPYRVGRFAHTLRLRLMREHLGLDVDEILEEERQAGLDGKEDFESEMDRIYKENEDSDDEAVGDSSRASRQRRPSFNRDVDLIDAYDGRRSSGSRASSPRRGRGKSVDAPPDDRGVSSEKHQKEVAGFGPDHWKSAEQHGLDEGRDSVIVHGHEVLIHDILPEGRGTLDHPRLTHASPKASSRAGSPDEGVGNSGMPTVPAMDRRTTEQLGLPRANQLPTLPAADDTDIGRPPVQIDTSGQPTYTHDQNPLTADIKLARIDKDCMRDPLNPSFYDEIWCRAAENNTKLYRRVFRCMPDNEVTNWAEYKEYKAYSQRFKESMDGTRSSGDEHGKGPDVPAKQASTGGGIGAPGPAAVAKVLAEKTTGGTVKAGGAEGPTVAGHHLPHLHSEKKALSDANLPDSKPAGGDGAIVDPEKRAAAEAETDDTRPDSPNDARLEVPGKTAENRRTTFSDPEKPPMTAGSGVSSTTAAASSSSPNHNGSNGNGNTGQPQPQKRGRRATTRGSRRGFSATDEVLGRQEAEELMGLTQGTLVQFPYDWLLTEEMNGNWLFQVDQVAPLQIYN